MPLRPAGGWFIVDWFPSHISMTHSSPSIPDPDSRRAIDEDRLRLKEARMLAEEIVRDHGWTEEDEDFEFQVEMEARRQWSELWKQEERAKGRWEDLA